MKSQGKRMNPSVFGSLFSCSCCSTALLWQFHLGVFFEATRHQPKSHEGSYLAIFFLDDCDVNQKD